ncbi:Putative sodium-dependent multivitamin transporter [Araneus ventricosus]|uniref:Sodium-dependent multivitamin transporter n=1 Tax=Araneus ventricosus TaxID=182803 RepID=A0A4Y2RZU9_ARAVE|nr:Putative sodium-dependent multivitamin transporter [Araneus ventricosus]
MDAHYHLGWIDYVVIGLTLLISTAIGLKFQFSGNRQRTTREYLLAGKNMSIFPVVMSITVTMLSAITLLGIPMETYRFGMKYALIVIPFSIGTILAAVIITPVYFNCRVSTTYEFLELRYGKTTRYAVSALFIIQMVLFMAVVLYAPVLALSAVTDLSIEASIVIFGLVCSFYCAVSPVFSPIGKCPTGHGHNLYDPETIEWFSLPLFSHEFYFCQQRSKNIA